MSAAVRRFSRWATPATILALVLATGLLGQAFAEGPYGSRQHRKRGIMNGNQVVTQFFNYGMIANWPTQPSGVWPKGTNHSYIDGVAMMVMAETYDVNGNLIHPMSTQYREDVDFDPITGEALGWEPLPGYANPNQDEPAMSDLASTWPWTWPDRDAAWDGYWNGYFGRGVFNADLETYFRMDDAKDSEYDFYPDPDDELRRGLGLNVGVRAFQWNHVLAEDCIFWHYDIENIGKTDYDKAIFGFLIDWGLGGTDNSSDDAGSYFTDIDLAYAWDGDGEGDLGWAPVGYAGFAYLESPGNETDGIDNDEDGIVDESRSDGIDNDGDWDPYLDVNENGEWDPTEPLNDDVGLDGVGPNDLSYTMPDEGEGDGLPTPGEPDFDALDKDESDQIGLTAFLIFALHAYQLIDEEQNWEALGRLTPPTDEQLEGVNLGMMFASGKFPLVVGQTERFSMALLFGNNENDLIRNKKTVQAIYNANYNFAQPPYKPTITANAGDNKVTLYWDTRAEDSYDRFLQEYDFEGYRIYRSTDPSFIDSKIVTDAYGNATFRSPLVQFDLDDGRFGPHPVNVYGATFDLGEDTGLRHSYVDTEVTNGMPYYYAVVSYDYGYIEGETLIDTLVAADGSDSVRVRFVPELDPSGNIIGIAPTECTSTIIGDVGGEVTLDINTATATPNAPAAGFTPPQLENGVEHANGSSNAEIQVEILNPDSLLDGHTYEVRFTPAPVFGQSFLNFVDGFQLYDITDNNDVLKYESPSGVFGYFGPYVEGDPIFWISDQLRRGRYFTEDPDADTLRYWHQAVSFFEPELIDGISVLPFNRFVDYAEMETVELDTAWYVTSGGTNYHSNIDFYRDKNGLMLSMKLPYSFEVRFSDEIVDTSISTLGSFKEIPVNFQVWNLTLDEPSDFVYLPDTVRVATGQGDSVDVRHDFWVLPKLTFEEEPSRIILGLGHYFLINNESIDTTVVGFDTTIVLGDMPILEPSAGDRQGYIAPVPFSPDDTYRFTVHDGQLDRGLEKEQLGQIAVVPNPYVVAAEWEPRVNFTSGRGPRKIDFIHLPKECTIRIYTMSGYLVDTIYHNEPMENGAESWNMVSKDGMDIAYGIYLYHVDAPGVGEHIGKFAVIK
ncbi:hypothetical protein KQI52_06060 [bacterium]|nr:hypothetical protein [bacterium]